MKERLVVIGGVAAGMSAAAKARRSNPELEVIVYEKSGYISYGACGFPYYIKGEVPDIDTLIVRTPEQAARQGIAAHVHHEVLHIDVKDKTVQVCDHTSGREFSERWDRLIVAAGASVSRPPIPGIHLPGIFTLRTTEDAIAIRDWITKRRPRCAVIIGAGYIGLEMAEALQAHDISVTIVDQADQVMPSLDPEMADLVERELKAQGVKIYLERAVHSFVGPAQMAEIVHKVATAVQRHSGQDVKGEPFPLRVREVVTANALLEADIVIFGIGGRPNVALAQQAGLTIGPTGAIAVDAEQRTNLPDIWAAGAVAEAFHLVTQGPAYVPSATTASKQGRVAGTNAAGGQARFGGVVGTSVVKSFDLKVAQTGLSEKWAKGIGLDVGSVTVEGTSRASYMAGSEPLHVKLVYERGTLRLLGAQIIGRDGVAKRIDVASAALRAGWTTRELAQLDLSYAPPVAPLWEPLQIAANIANR